MSDNAWATGLKSPEWLQSARSNAPKGAARWVIIILMVVFLLAIGIVAAVLGRKSGDDKCTCIGVNDAGFRAFSIVMIALGIPLLVIVMIFFGCTVE